MPLRGYAIYEKIRHFQNLVSFENALIVKRRGLLLQVCGGFSPLVYCPCRVVKRGCPADKPDSPQSNPGLSPLAVISFCVQDSFSSGQGQPCSEETER